MAFLCYLAPVAVMVRSSKRDHLVGRRKQNKKNLSCLCYGETKQSWVSHNLCLIFHISTPKAVVQVKQLIFRQEFGTIKGEYTESQLEVLIIFLGTQNSLSDLRGFGVFWRVNDHEKKKAVLPQRDDTLLSSAMLTIHRIVGHEYITCSNIQIIAV